MSALWVLKTPLRNTQKYIEIYQRYTKIYQDIQNSKRRRGRPPYASQRRCRGLSGGPRASGPDGRGGPAAAWYSVYLGIFLYILDILGYTFGVLDTRGRGPVYSWARARAVPNILWSMDRRATSTSHYRPSLAPSMHDVDAANHWAAGPRKA